MKRPETQTPEIVLVIDEVEALKGAGVATGLCAHLEQVLIAARQAGAICLPGGMPGLRPPGWTPAIWPPSRPHWWPAR